MLASVGTADDFLYARSCQKSSRRHFQGCRCPSCPDFTLLMGAGRAGSCLSQTLRSANFVVSPIRNAPISLRVVLMAAKGLLVAARPDRSLSPLKSPGAQSGRATPKGVYPFEYISSANRSFMLTRACLPWVSLSPSRSLCVSSSRVNRGGLCHKIASLCALSFGGDPIAARLAGYQRSPQPRGSPRGGLLSRR